MKSIGVDIGSSSVKIAEIETSNTGYALTRFAEFPLSTDPGRDNQLEIIEILRRVAGQSDLHHTRFVFGVRQGQVSTRLKHFPFKERHKVLKKSPI